MENNKEPKQPDNISKNIFEQYLNSFTPAKTTAGAELKTTFDIIEDVSAVITIEKWEVVQIMHLRGFKTILTDAGFFWMMKKA